MRHRRFSRSQVLVYASEVDIHGETAPLLCGRLLAIDNSSFTSVVSRAFTDPE
jgi:hypothetical protein